MRRVPATMCAATVALLLAACGGRDGPAPGGPGALGGPGGPGAEVPDDDGYGPIDAADPNAGGAMRPGKPGGPDSGARYSPLKYLVRYVVKPDGSLTRADLIAGLKRDFEAADLNHNGKLEPNEFRPINQQRWQEAGAAASPLTDWNEDGFIDLSEYSAMALSLFDLVDADHDGVLTAKELRQEVRPQKQQEPPKIQRQHSDDGRMPRR